MVEGLDAFEFLQGLITQDMTLLDGQNVIYAALLTPQGKFDFDFFVWKQGIGYLLECEAHRAEALLKHLSIFKLRRNVSLNNIVLQVVTLWGTTDALKAFSYDADPRHNTLGLRKIFMQDIDKQELNEATEVEYNFYDRLRIGYGIPDGTRDMAVGEDTVADLGLDKLNGVSHSKGCYMGQELTSRMHHRGLAKKGLYTVRMTGTSLPPYTDIVGPDGSIIGEMRSNLGDIGLALLRHDALKDAAQMGLVTEAADTIPETL